MIIAASQVDAVRFLSRGRALYEDVSLHCGVQSSEEFQLVPREPPGLAYFLRPLHAFGPYQGTNSPLCVALYEGGGVESGQGSTHVGLVRHPQARVYPLDTLEYSSILYIRLSVFTRHDRRKRDGTREKNAVEVRASLQYDRVQGLSLLEGREYRDLVCYMHDTMHEMVAEFVVPMAP